MSTHVLKVKSENSGVRLDIFLAKNIPDCPSRTLVKKLIDGGHVTVNEKLLKGHHKVKEGEEVHVTIPGNFQEPSYIAPEDIPLDIFYEDECLYVINKPSGMLVHPARGRYSNTLVNALLHHAVKLSDFNTNMRPGIVHRLDEETSGLILIAKDNITHTKLAKQFQRHVVKKKYVALVEGEIEFDEGLINAPIGRHPRQRDKKFVLFDDGAKDSVTRYRVIKRVKGVTLVALMPKTGRMHQLRVHMAYQRHPILGDSKYGKKSTFFRLALHAQAIGFTHPSRKSWVEFSTPIPAEFLARVV